MVVRQSVPLDLLSLLAMLTLIGSHADMCTENYDASCPTTATASTTIGVSLVQALSARIRVTKSLLEHGAKGDHTDLGVRDEGYDATGPKGQRDLSLAPRTFHDPGDFHGPGEATAATGDEPTHTSMSPIVLRPLLADRPGHEDDIVADAWGTTLPDADAMWGALRKLRNRMARLTSFLQEGTNAVRHSLQVPARSTTHTPIGGLILAILLLIVLGFIYWKVTRPEKDTNSMKFPIWHHPASVPRLSPARSVTRSPGAMSVPVGEPRHLATATTGHFSAGGTLMDNSSEDEANIAARPVDGDGFCPDLVVPQQCECILVVPVYAPAGNFSICDMNGRAVLQASTQMQGQGLLWQLHLQTATGTSPQTLARCIEVRPTTGNSTTVEFRILDAEGKHFATLTQVQGQQRFELTTTNGFKLYFYGNFQTQAINVTDEDDSLLATTEPCGMDFEQTGIYYRLRVAPLANVGHSLCALLCIGQILRPKSLP